MNPSRINPLNISPSASATSTEYLKHTVQSITMGIRVGENVDVNIGLIQKFNWTIDRTSSEIYQIEPVIDGVFGTVANGLAGSGQDFFGSKYFPGEVVELIPGKQGAASLSLSRCVLYGSNIFSALMSIEDAGTESSSSSSTPSSTELSTMNFGGSLLNYVTLIQQVRPIYIKQVFYNPIDGTIAWGREFQDCWIEKWSEEIPDANENKAIVDSIEMKATRIRPLKNMTGSISAQV